jgi:hypothetical protein
MGWRDESTQLSGVPLGGSSSSSDSTSAAQPFWQKALGLVTAGPAAQAALEKSYPGSTKAIWDKPADMSWGDYAAAHAGPAMDTARMAIAQAPYGGNLVDVQGAEQRLKGTPQAGAGEALGMAGIAAGTEGAGVGRAIAGKVAPAATDLVGERTGNLIARAIGGGTEQGTLAGLGTAGHGGSIEDIAKSTGLGFVTGGITGPGGKAGPETPSTADLLTAAQSKLQPLEKIQGNPAAVKNALESVKNNMVSKQATGISDTLSGRVDKIINDLGTRKVITADDVADYQRQLMKSSRGSTDQRIAGDFNRALDQTLGPYASRVADANRAMNIAKTSRDIEGWAALGDEAPDKIAGALAKRPGLYQAQPGLFDALSQVGQMKPNWMHRAGNELVSRGTDAALGYGASALLGGGQPASIGMGLLGAAIGPKMKPFGPPVKGSLAAARHLAATGKNLPASAFNGSGWYQPVLDAARQAGYGMSGSGRL